MGRKKKRERPIIFCYYCDRIFENERVLIQHQRAKHFQCPWCTRKISSAHGMQVHAFQVHQRTIDEVPASKDGRSTFDIEIFGMDGVPQDIVDKMRLKVYGETAVKKSKPNPQQTVAPTIQIPGTSKYELQRRMVPIGMPFGQPRLMPFNMPRGQPQGMPMAHLPSTRFVMAPPGVAMPRMIHPSHPVRRMLISHPGIIRRQIPSPLLQGIPPPPPKLMLAPAQGRTIVHQPAPPPRQLLIPFGTPLATPHLPPQTITPQPGFPPLTQSLPPSAGQTPIQSPTQGQQTIVRTKKKHDGFIMYADETLSQEERRAMLPKYSGHLDKSISSLNESIEARMETLIS